MMPRIPLLGDALSRLLDVNTRYYATLGRVTADFLRELAVALEVPPLVPEERRRTASNGAHHPPEHHSSEQHPPAQYAPHEPASPPRPPVQAAAPQQAVILLEAEADQTAVGVFLVGNPLNHEVQARPQAWPFYDPPGTTSVPHLVFEPEVISLAPREQTMIKILATVDTSLQPEVRYRCEVSVPALADTRIPVVIRRRPDRPKFVVESHPIASETRAPEPAASTAVSKETAEAVAKPARRPVRPGKRSRNRKKAMRRSSLVEGSSAAPPAGAEEI